MELNLILSKDIWLPLKDLPCFLTDAYFSWDSMSFHLVGNEYTVSKDVVSNNFWTNDTCDNSSCMDSDSHIEVLEQVFIWLVSNFSNYINHLKTCLDNSVSFIDNNCSVSFSLVDSTIVAHNNIAITDGVHLVDFIFFSLLIKPWKELREKIDNFSWIFNVLAERSKTNNVGEK